MEKECKSYVNPRCAAAGIFYITLRRLKINIPIGGQIDIGESIGTTAWSVRKAWEKYKGLFDDLKEEK